MHYPLDTHTYACCFTGKLTLEKELDGNLLLPSEKRVMINSLHWFFTLTKLVTYNAIYIAESAIRY